MIVCGTSINSELILPAGEGGGSRNDLPSWLPLVGAIENV